MYPCRVFLGCVLFCSTLSNAGHSAQLTPPYLVSRSGSGGGLYSATVGDFDGDGHSDVAVLSVVGGGTTEASILSIMYGRDSLFSPGVDAGPIAQHQRPLLAGDVNHDGRDDLVGASYGSGQSATIVTSHISTPSGFYSVTTPFSRTLVLTALKDITGDGIADLVAVVGDSIAILKGTGDGTFSFQSNVFAGITLRQAIVTRISPDPWPSLIGFSSNSTTICILHGLGNNQFAPSDIRDILPGVSQDAKVVDLDGDGDNDVMVLCSGGEVVSILNDAQFPTTRVTTQVGATATCIEAGHLNGDSLADLAVAYSDSGGYVASYIGAPGLRFVFGDAAAFGSTSALIGVFDATGDGNADVVGIGIDDFSQDGVAVVRGHGNGTIGDAEQIGVEYPVTLLPIEFDGDTKPDLAVGSGIRLEILKNTGSRHFGPVQIVSPNANVSAFTTGDVNGDGQQDVVAADWIDGVLAIVSRSGSGVAVSHQPLAFSGAFGGITTGDINKDGIDDLVMFGSNVYTRLGTTSGIFGASQIVGAGDAEGVATVMDVGNDALPALVLLDVGVGGIALYQQDAGIFTRRSALPLHSFPFLLLSVDSVYTHGVIAIFGDSVTLYKADTTSIIPVVSRSGGDIKSATLVDIDRDGYPDLVVADNAKREVDIYYGSVGGWSTQADRYPAGGGEGAMVVEDLNGDGWPDIVVANNYAYHLTIMINNGDASTPTIFNLVSDAVQSDGSVLMRWQCAECVQAEVVRSDDGGITWNHAGNIRAGAGGILEWRDSRVTPGRQYDYALRPVGCYECAPMAIGMVSIPIATLWIDSISATAGGLVFALNRDGGSDLSIDILDVQGRKISNSRRGLDLRGRHLILVEHKFPQGIYFARVQEGTAQAVRKFVVAY